MSDNSTNVSANQPSGKRGRPAIVSNEAFISAHNASNSVDEVIGKLPALNGMDAKKARLYVSMRSTALRKAGHQLHNFQRGRKTEVAVQAQTSNPVME